MLLLLHLRFAIHSICPLAPALAPYFCAYIGCGASLSLSSLPVLVQCTVLRLLCVTCDLIKCIPSLFSLRHALRSAPSLCLLPYHPFNVYLSLSVQPAAEAEGAATRLNAKRLMQGLRAPYFFALVIRDSGPRRLPFECHLLHHPYHPSTSAIST